MQQNFSLKELQKIVLRFKSTIAISLLTLIAFIFLSNASFFISTRELLKLALTSFQLENAVHYMLIHVGYKHLAVNLVSFIAFSLVAEFVLGSKHAFAIFWISGIVAGMTYVLLNPNIALIGASAGVSGLLGAAFVSDWKKTLLAILAMLFITVFFVYPLTSGAFDEFKKSITQKQTTIQSDLNKAIEQKDFNKAADLNKNLQQTTQIIEQTQKGEKFAEQTPTSNEIHAFGAIIGIGYVLVLKKYKKKSKV
ncbi:MAG: rhomboid family intramembrane serine protease [archaeon]|nr:rhomboid family intramembrane serine protease [archaeon]